MSRLPIIGVTACSAQNGLHAYHIHGDLLVGTRALAAKGLSAILASPANGSSPSVILDGLDGTPITVTPFNIEPIHNGGAAFVQRCALDSARHEFAGLSLNDSIACARQIFPRDADASNIA
ncbi:glutamine amidotransferase [Pseudomonas sp. C1C7]|uniref:gamma-glutamyl-gamma-aminobutyrate hydrolase family protein n=1 Tax=Pseudomonas sp. C1C7 TaxID=2735272 RepID=UPI001585D365|nr:gamma-glutamyl-gamma-aminobutyrate hydrolase family protein [Pseudomonas sp. C1C7]NUT78395.1 glutamine amidotransferase [Pseudomonas sp. C1C7]